MKKSSLIKLVAIAFLIAFTSCQEEVIKTKTDNKRHDGIDNQLGQ